MNKKRYDIKNVVLEVEEKLKDSFNNVDKIRYDNQIKVLEAFKRNRISESHFYGTSGYGYNDIGRDTIEKLYSDIFKAEDALVRHQIVSGTHAIAIGLFGLLRPDDLLLSVVGEPYDTLNDVIGHKGSSDGSLYEYGVKYDYVPLKNGKVDLEELINKLKKKLPKVCLVQRSRGYSKRKSLTIIEIKEIIECIKNYNENIIIMVDNCYGEFIERREPIEVGADLMVGSLIKNPGGGLASAGGYLVGRRDVIEHCSFRMTCPGIGREVGASMGRNKEILQGLFFAPHIVSESLKASMLSGGVAKKLGYLVYPDYADNRADIVQAIEFGNETDLILFCQEIQAQSPIDSYVKPVPWEMPGYENPVIMAAGTFVQGSSIELSCDAPIKEPYIAYIQGGLFYDHTKYALINAFETILNKNGKEI